MKPMQYSPQQKVSCQPNVNSAVLKRLIEEVRVEKVQGVGDRYDRVHNRHNR